jgi:hypothetical protein
MLLLLHRNLCFKSFIHQVVLYSVVVENTNARLGILQIKVSISDSENSFKSG